MKDESSYIIRKKNIHYNEEKCDLFFDYDNSYSLEKLTNDKISKTYTLNNNYQHSKINCYNVYRNNYLTNNDNYNSSNKSYDDLKSTKINSSFNSIALNDFIQNKKNTFKNLFNSMDKIIDKHKNDVNILTNNYESKKQNNLNDKKENLNKIVDHLIKVYSKDELKFIKEKIDNKVEEEEEEPQPEKFLYTKHKNYLKLSSDIPSFLKTNNNIDQNNNKNNSKNIEIKRYNNKNQFLKKINKNINYKPIKINSKISNLKIKNKNINKYKNIRLINKSDLSDNKIKFKSQFYTYIKCKTSFECLDNFLKRQKSYNNYISNKKINLSRNKNIKEGTKHTFIPNTSLTSNSKYSIKIDAQRLNESKTDKDSRMIYKTIKNKNEKYNNLKLKYNKSFSFSPKINNQGKIDKERPKSYKMKNNKNEKKENKDLKPLKYINHKFDYITSIYKNDKELFKRIKEQNDKKTKKFEKLKTEYENQKLEGCTFKPDMNQSYHKSLSYIKKYKNELIKINKIPNNEQEPRKTYVDFYQFKKNIQKKKNNNKDIEKIGSLTPILISKKISKKNSINNKK